MRPPVSARGTAWSAPALAGAGSAALFASIALAWLSPLPLAWIARHRGRAGTTVAVAVALAVAAVLVGSAGASEFAVQFAVGGCALGFALRARRRPEAVIGAFAVTVVLGYWLRVGLLAGAAGVGLTDFLAQQAKLATEYLRPLVQSSGVGPEEAQRSLEEMAAAVVAVLPGLHAALMILVGWLNALLLRRFDRDHGVAPWCKWRAPDAWIWVLLGSGFTAFLIGGTPGRIGLNMLLPAAAVYFLQGMAVIHDLFETRRFPPLFRGITYALLLFQPPVMLVVAGLGAFDLWVDFRTRWAPSAGPPP